MLSMLLARLPVYYRGVCGLAESQGVNISHYMKRNKKSLASQPPSPYGQVNKSTLLCSYGRPSDKSQLTTDSSRLSQNTNVGSTNRACMHSTHTHCWMCCVCCQCLLLHQIKADGKHSRQCCIVWESMSVLRTTNTMNLFIHWQWRGR
jgi:hypothetical protein